jgi:hypothetical protein
LEAGLRLSLKYYHYSKEKERKDADKSINNALQKLITKWRVEDESVTVDNCPDIKENKGDDNDKRQGEGQRKGRYFTDKELRSKPMVDIMDREQIVDFVVCNLRASRHKDFFYYHNRVEEAYHLCPPVKLDSVKSKGDRSRIATKGQQLLCDVCKKIYESEPNDCEGTDSYAG